MNVRSLGISTSLILAAFAIACSGAERRSGFSETENAADGGAGGFGGEGPGKASECAINNSSSDLDTDFDGDGFPLKDDCNECNTAINKGAHDIPGNGIDEDCSGTPDDEEIDCDVNVDGSTDPFDAAKAIGLCKKADPDGRDWGVVKAKWVKPDGTSLKDMEGVNIVTSFGANDPQLGSTMLVLSSGEATESAPITKDKGYSHGTPDGYPKESPACPGVTTGGARDGAALELTIRVPTNAQSLSYQQNFFTQEYPAFICSTFNDFFVTMMDPAPAGLEDGNIAFDQDTNPISVNNSLLQVCEPGTHKNKTFLCPLGTDGLSGTSFKGHAGTGWLTTSAPVEPGSEIKLRFAIWDSGDGALDSTVLIDDFKFSVDGAETAQTKPSEPK